MAHPLGPLPTPAPEPQQPRWWSAWWPPQEAETAVMLFGSALMFSLGVVAFIVAAVLDTLGFGVLGLLLFILGFLGPGLASLTFDARRGVFKGTTHRRRSR